MNCLVNKEIEVGFDYSKYMYSQNLYGSIFIEDINDIDIIETNKINLITFIQNSIFDVLEKLLPKEHLGILLGMLIGDTFYISDDVEIYFKLSGITHLLAVSGSNVTYIIAITKFLFKKLFGKNLSNYFSIFMIILFVLISGASPSVVRAGIMAIILIFSEILGRAANTFSTIATTAIIMLLSNPLIICDIGFLLSFGGTVGIVLLNNIFTEYFNIKFCIVSNNKLFKYVLEMFTVSLSAQIILLPIMWYYFNNISFISILTNLLVGPFVGIITVLGLVMYFLSLIYMPIGKLISYCLYVLISLIILISKCCSKVPFGNIILPTPSLFLILIYYLVLYLVIQKLKSKINKIKEKYKKENYKITQLVKLIVSALVITQMILIILPKNYIEVNIIDVGQGDSTLIKTNNGNILIDGGGSENRNYDVGKQILLPYLLDNTNGTIDILFISHFHDDHAEGCLTVLENLKVKKIVIGTQPQKTDLYERLLNISKKKNIPVITLSKEETIKLGKASFLILYPNQNLQIKEDLNNNSLVIRMDYYNVSMLFTGDIEKETEKILIEEYSQKESRLDVDILKVAHHGSKSSSGKEFLKQVSPKLSLISLGVDNKFGHPHEEVINRLIEIKTKIYRTDEKGEISMKIYKNGRIKVKTKL